MPYTDRGPYTTRREAAAIRRRRQVIKQLVPRCEGCESDFAAPGDDANFCAACRERWEQTELDKDKPNPWRV